MPQGTLNIWIECIWFSLHLLNQTTISKYSNKTSVEFSTVDFRPFIQLMQLKGSYCRSLSVMLLIIPSLFTFYFLLIPQGLNPGKAIAEIKKMMATYKEKVNNPVNIVDNHRTWNPLVMTLMLNFRLNISLSTVSVPFIRLHTWKKIQAA